MKKNMERITILLVVLSLVINMSFSNGSQEKEGTPVVIKFGYKSTTETDQHRLFSEMSNIVKEKTNSRVVVELYPNAQLGENKEIVEQALLGGDVMGQVSPGDLGEYVPDYGILPGPYLFDTWDDFLTLVNSPLVKEWDDTLATKAGINVVSYMYFGTRDIYTGNKKVESLKDLKGLKIRVQPVKIYVEMIKALGAVPTPLPWAEVYSALSQGLIDAAEAPPRAMFDYKHNEVSKYLILDDHILDASAIFISASTLNKISDTDKDILLDEIDQAVDKITQANLSTREKYLNEVEKSGVTIIRNINRDEFKKASEQVYTKFDEWSPNLYENVKEIIRKGK